MKKFLRITVSISSYCLTLVGLWLVANIHYPVTIKNGGEFILPAITGVVFPLFMAGLVVWVWENDSASLAVEKVIGKFLKMYFTLVVYGSTLVSLYLVNNYFDKHRPNHFEVFAFPQVCILIAAGVITALLWHKEIWAENLAKQTSETTDFKQNSAN